LKKNRIKKFELSEEAIKAFEHLKTSMATCHVVITPDFKKPFTIQCDASTTGVGGVLFQTDDEGGDVISVEKEQISTGSILRKTNPVPRCHVQVLRKSRDECRC